MQSISIDVLTVSIPVLLMVFLYNISPVFAKEVTKKAASKSAAKVATVTVKKSPSIWKKILDGANATGSFKNWKVGDSRAEFSALLNAFSSLAILG